MARPRPISKFVLSPHVTVTLTHVTVTLACGGPGSSGRRQTPGRRPESHDSRVNDFSNGNHEKQLVSSL